MNRRYAVCTVLTLAVWVSCRSVNAESFLRYTVRSTEGCLSSITAGEHHALFDKKISTVENCVVTVVAMKRTATVFLQAVILLIGIGILAFMLWLPQVEGRNANATQFEIYFKDPFLAFVYLGSIAFFAGLYQVFKFLGCVANKQVFSIQSVRSLRIIKRCALTLVAFLAAAEIYFLIVVRGNDDIAGGVMMGLVLILICSIVAAAAAIFEKTLQSAVDLKAENDLTV